MFNDYLALIDQLCFFYSVTFYQWLIFDSILSVTFYQWWDKYSI